MAAEVEQAVAMLKASGLMKQEEGGRYSVVESYEEHQAIKQQIQQDQELAERLARENQSLQQSAPDQERMRAGAQLEPNPMME